MKNQARPWWIRITAPIWLLRIVTFFGDIIGHLTGKISALNNDKYQILKQRNWRCNIQPATEELGYKPQYDLKKGVKETIKWYKEEGWLQVMKKFIIDLFKLEKKPVKRTYGL